MMDSKPIGRDAEIIGIWALISAASGAPAALSITGDAGIGKALICQHVFQAARSSSRVLSCRPILMESPPAFSALEDLPGDVAEEIMLALPGPRRRAVEVVLLRDASSEPPSGNLPDAGRKPPERWMLARGILDLIRVFSTGAPLVIAVDDAQWMGRPSAAVLEFCFRRLQAEHVLILLTFRNDHPVPLNVDRIPRSVRLGQVQLGPLSLGAIGEILRSRLGGPLPRYALTRLSEARGGNPSYALECTRTFLSRARIPLTNEPVPIPPSLSDLVRRRIGQLTPGVRHARQLVAASPHPRERLIRGACNDEEFWAAIDLAVDASPIARDGDMLRFTHPLPRSAPHNEMPLAERRQVRQSRHGLRSLTTRHPGKT